MSTPKELARQVCLLNIEECVEFFNEIGNIMYNTNDTTLKDCIQEIINSDNLTVKGKLLMSALKQNCTKIDPDDKYKYHE